MVKLSLNHDSSMQLFEWSSPTRENDHQSLESIPFEIYQEIFNNIQEDDDMSSQEVTRVLSNLAPVCRLFSSIALPRLFSSVEFIIWESRDGSSRTTDRPTTRFCRALVADQEPANSLAQYVKSCTFTNWNPRDPDNGRVGTHVSLLTLYCKALPKMNRVESVSLVSLEIDKHILEAVESLPLIKSLSFVACDLAPDLDLDQFEIFLQRQCLESFTALSLPTHILSIATSPSFAFGALTSLRIDNWTIVKQLANHHPIESLTDFTIWEVTDLTLLPTLFSKMPKLLYLCIQYFISARVKDVDSIHLPQHLITKLSHFDGPPALAKILVPGRPIRKAILPGNTKGTSENPNSSLFKSRLWEALGKSTTPIRELLIPEHLYDIKSVQKYVPELVILSITWPALSVEDVVSILGGEIEPLVSHICKRDSALTSIHRVAFKLDTIVAHQNRVYFHLQSQHEVIDTLISVALPNVKHVNFIDFVNWRRTGPGGTWRADIPKGKGKRENVLCRIQVEDRKEVLENDYGDCFKTFFDPSNPEYLDYAEM